MSETSLTYGLNSGGFVRMRLPEVRRSIFNDLTNRTGIIFDETPDSFTGEFISVFAEREAKLWELLEKVYLSPYPVTAQGMSLDLAVSYAGVRRLQPVRSMAPAYFLGTPGTVVPQGSIIQAAVASDAADIPPRFLVETQVTLSKTAVVGAGLTVPAGVVAGTIYWVEIAGVRYSVTAAAGQNADQVAAALDAVLGNDAAREGAKLTIFRPLEFVIDWSNSLSVDYIMCLGKLASEAFGPVPAEERTLSRIISPVSGLQSVYNPNAAVPGQVLETDDQLRGRYSLGVFRLGAGTMPSIYANIRQDVPGVASLRVFENTTSVIDADGRPPHSIELIVEGGDTQAIIDKIYKVKPSGIAAYGNTSGTVRAADGYLHPISFSRPEPRWIWLRVAYSTNPEETIPGDIAGQIVAAILASAATLNPGQDVVLQRLEAAPFSALPGLAKVTITAAVTAPNAVPPTVYTASDIAIGPRQKAAFDISRIII